MEGVTITEALAVARLCSAVEARLQPALAGRGERWWLGTAAAESEVVWWEPMGAREYYDYRKAILVDAADTLLAPTEPIAQVGPRLLSRRRFCDGEAYVYSEMADEAGSCGGGGREAVKKQAVQSVVFHDLFGFANPLDWLLMAAGSAGAVVHGAAMSVFFLLFASRGAWNWRVIYSINGWIYEIVAEV